MRKSKNCYFYHIFSPGDARGAITLNVVWMEREFDAYKLSRCMCPSKYNRFWDTARFLFPLRTPMVAKVLWTLCYESPEEIPELQRPRCATGNRRNL